LNPNELLYLGPSNVYGPGSAWRITDGPDLEPRWDLAAAVPDDKLRDRLIVQGREADCSTSSSSSWSITPDLLLSAGTVPLSGELKADLSGADTVNVRITTWRIDRLNELEYEHWMEKDSGEYAADVRNHANRRLIMKSAVHVEGFSADFEYKSNLSERISAKYKLRVTTDLGGGLSLSRTGENKLHIESRVPFYIVGTLVAVKPDGFGMMEASGSRSSQLFGEGALTIPATAHALPPQSN
jgi:hypothetical protein